MREVRKDLAVLALLTTLTLAALPTQMPALPLSHLPDEDQLARLVWEHSPEMAQLRGQLGEADAEALRARLFPNPSLSVTWGTIPVGPTNPPGLEHPLAHVPNYTAALSETFELGKRGPRREAADRAREAARFGASDELRRQLLDLYSAIGRAAAGAVRFAAIDGLAADAARLSDLQRQRVKHGDAAGLDADRALLEQQSLQASLLAERQREREALLDCSRLSGLRCEPFASADDAQRFLSAGSALPADVAAQLERRPDLRALLAQQRSAEAAASLARARRIPDPTVQAGFTFDTFTVSGNQPRSLNLNLCLPLPIFDHGQADLTAAAAQQAAARTARLELLTQARHEVSELLDAAASLQRRRAELQQATLPLAHSVVDRLALAVATGGAPLQDLLLARRSLGELLQAAADLDLEILQNTLAVRRAAAAGPELPEVNAS